MDLGIIEDFTDFAFASQCIVQYLSYEYNRDILFHLIVLLTLTQQILIQK